MTKNCSTVNKGVFSATVCANKWIGDRFYRLGLEFSGAAAEAFAAARPGQFVELEMANVPLPPAEDIPAELADAACRDILLRRPFSFAGTAVKEQKSFVDILYRVIGPATLRMTTLSASDSVSVIGPLGNGFRVPEDKETALLVAGGMGAGPLLFLAKVITEDFPDIDVIAFAGAKTAKQLPFERKLDKLAQLLGFSIAEFAGYGIKSLVATDDGSMGFAGLVTGYLSRWLKKADLAGERTIIYGCGPQLMLAKTAQIADSFKIDCQVSMERMMACGIGLCQGCAVECRTAGSADTVYKMCCKDGPVFEAGEVIF